MLSKDPGTVVIVDDDAAVRRGLERLFRAAGWEARSFASAEEFLSRSWPRLIACLVLDFHLEVMNGLGLQMRLKEAGSKVPIIFISGRSDNTVRERVLLTISLRRQPRRGPWQVGSLTGAVAS